MQAFTKLDGLVVPLDRANVDTDAIIPKQFLKSIKRAGFGPNLFDEWRYLDHGEPGKPNHDRPLNPDFVLNQPRYQDASVLLARENFGCGSSREHAPWAIMGYGFRAVVSTSFADIFRNNSLKLGLVPVIVDEETHWQIKSLVEEEPDTEITIDLERQELILPDGRQVEFPIDNFSKACILKGVNQLGYLQSQTNAIAAYEASHPDRVNTLAA